MQESTKLTTKHIDYLDSARGLAALMVVFYHFINWHYNYTQFAKISSFVFNGADAVSFFFVLSGFVLSYKYMVGGQPLDVKKFYIQRIFRLWPAYVFTIAINCVYSIYNDLSVHKCYEVFILNKTGFWEEVFLIRYRSVYFGAGWTLAVELLMSFFIPFAIVLAKKDNRILYWFIFVILLMGANATINLGFMLGLVITCNFQLLNSMSFKETKWYKYRYLLLVLGVLLFSLREIDRLYRFGATYKAIADYLRIDFFMYSALASFIFLIAIIQSKFLQKILQHRILLFYGKISYGVYLMHWLVVNFLYAHLGRIFTIIKNPTLAIALMLIFCLVTTTISATVFHYVIELPFIRMGKRLTQRLKPSLVIN